MMDFHKKQAPFQGITGLAGGATGLRMSSGAALKTYIDDVFSTYLWTGTGGNITHTNGLDLSTEGGFTWIKGRSDAYAGTITDTLRGTTKQLQTAVNNPEITSSARLTAFNTNGFTTGYEELVGQNNSTYSSWSFRKTEKFCTVKTWSGTQAIRTLTHDLGCVPGLVIIKRYDGYGNWAIYHRDVGTDKFLFLNTSAAESQSNDYWNDTLPTDSVITLGNQSNVNGPSADNYVGYFFGGGASTAATARSVDFDGSGDFLTVAGPGALGTSTNFTMECWVYPDSTSGNQRIFTSNEVLVTGEYTQFRINAGEWEWNIGGSGGSWTAKAGTVTAGQWYHVALVRNGTNTSFYVNGALLASNTNSHSVTISTLCIGGFELSGSGLEYLNGKVSNARFVNGTAVYTSAFKPPTEPLTSITNTSLLCCNDSSTTGKTTGGTITANGDPTASTDSPFDDPANFAFGENGDQNIIKCGSYVGNSSSSNEVYVGWEPQWVMIKRSTDVESWAIVDAMRGIVTDGVDARLQADTNSAEAANDDRIDLTPTGFKLTSSNAEYNGVGTYIYMAIRRPDGYVGKPAELGTDVFAMDTGNDSSTIPAFDSNFIVDYALYRKPATSFSWTSNARLTGTFELVPNTTAAETSGDPDLPFDSNVGYAKNRNNTYQSWMWKRGQGFDVVTYEGGKNIYNSSLGASDISHNLGKIPEMIWVKRRNTTENWVVYHNGFNDGTSPENYRMFLNTTDTESTTWSWAQTAPTSTRFTVADGAWVNGSGSDYLAMLFASVDSISKCGYYDGSSSDITITTGFTPRFILIKRTNGGSYWHVFDSLRGMGASGNDAKILLNEAYAQTNTKDFVNTTTTGFVVKAGADGDTSTAGGQYIYYAHA